MKVAGRRFEGRIMRAKWIVTAVLTLAACTRNPDAAAQRGTVAAAPVNVKRVAADLAAQYSQSQLKDWKLEVMATGSDCRVLFVKTPVIMEESMVEGLHYGVAAFQVREGGIEKYYREHEFRGVTYQDGSGHRWRFGDVGEAEIFAPCR